MVALLIKGNLTIIEPYLISIYEVEENLKNIKFKVFLKNS